ncbi:MAG: gamma-glutamyl-gamma-aminobutyrate hydrolase family protein [bacterium]
MTLLIGLSFIKKNDPHYQKYTDALVHAGNNLEHEILIRDLSEEISLVESIDGIVFTGGADVNPDRYGKPELAFLCPHIENDRDEIEFQIAAAVEKRNLPTLGICRGLQLLNVYHGGTLIADLVHAGKLSHSKIHQTDLRHDVITEPGKLLRKITCTSESSVASSHHQAIDQLAPGLISSAKSAADGVIEAIEWNDQSAKPYFLAVQWHPERMDYEESLSGPIFESFLWEVAANKILGRRK